MFGDPHFVSFDNATFKFRDSKLNKFWAVHSKAVQIQGLSRGHASRMLGIAVTGPFIGNKRLVAYKTAEGTDHRANHWKQAPLKVLFDGKEVLSADGTKHE